jgi:hypothetical protein
MSDILTASGNKVSTDIMSCCPQGEAWLNKRWPNKHRKDSDFQVWKNSMLSICPGRSNTSRVEKFIHKTHRIWQWLWCKIDSTLHCLNKDGKTEDVFVLGRKPNQYQHLHTQPCSKRCMICSVQPTPEEEYWQVLSTAPRAKPIPVPSSFLDVLQSWENTWLWEHLTMSGGVTWIVKSITDGTLVAITDGSYIRELFPKLCLATFVLECSKGRGRIVGSFSEESLVANAYRGELLELMAIHLILLSINNIPCSLSGSLEIVSDCLWALKRVTYLPPYRIPSWCGHSDILKTILVHCQGLSFMTYYSHIKAHQDDNASFDKLSQKAQLNCICNHAAKQRITADGMEGAMPGWMFPLEPIGLFVRGKK